MRYFIDVAGDNFTCTSTLERNENGNYEFYWESDFQSGTTEYTELEGNVVEINKAEFDLIKMTVVNDGLLHYQSAIKELVINENLGLSENER